MLMPSVLMAIVMMTSVMMPIVVMSVVMPIVLMMSVVVPVIAILPAIAIPACFLCEARVATVKTAFAHRERCGLNR